MIAVIMAGGQGTRLREVNKEIPKALFTVAEKTIIEYQIENLKRCGVEDIILIRGYLGEAIQSFCGDGSTWNVHIEYILEEEPLGTGGGLYYLKGKVQDDFLLFYGDLIMDVDFGRMMDFHWKHKAVVTLYTHPNSHPYDSDLVETDRMNRVTGILSKHDKRDGSYHNLVNAGVYCINSKALEWYDDIWKVDLDKEFITAMIETKKVFSYRSTEYVKDMGTPDRLSNVEKDVNNGLVKSRNMSNKQKAVFLDRDGTINELDGFIRSPEQLRLINGISDAIKRLNNSEYLTIIVTNQPVIARGECSEEGLEEIHKKLETELGRAGAYVDAIFYCPHHPDKGYEGEISELKMDCNCRKPKVGMIEEAVNRFNIDLRNSWMVGDSTVDVQTGINAGIRTILLSTGERGRDRRYDCKAYKVKDSLMDAVYEILGGALI